MRKNRKCGEYKTEENQMSFAITMLNHYAQICY